MRLGSAVLLTLIACLCASAQDTAPAIIQKRCLACHNSTQKMGGLTLENKDSALRGGKSGPALDSSNYIASLMWNKVESGQMPVGNPLPPGERAILRSWLEAGAPWTESLAAQTRPRAGKSWWSLQPLKRVDPPAPPGIPSEWSGSAIDRFLFAALTAKKLKPNPPADRRTLIRRISFDLTGLPPAPEDVDRFENDPSPRAYEELVDRLLASPAYGERWGRHWLDVARFGESHGYEQNRIRTNAWPYRDYIIRSLNQDKPFDRMVIEQLAGDVVGRGDPDIEVATGFLVAGPHDTVGNQAEAAKRQQRANDLDDMINATAAGFLGLTVNCARCHDHKFDPIQQADYYRLAAIFAGVHFGEREIATAEERRTWEQKAKPVEAALKEAERRMQEMKSAAKPKMDALRGQVLSQYRPPVSPRLTEETFSAVPARFIRLRAHSGAAGGLDEFEVFTPGNRNVALASAGATVRASSTRRPEASPEAYSEKHLNDGKFDRRWFADGFNPVDITVELPRETLVSRAAWSSDRSGGFMGRFEAAIVRFYTLEVSTDGKTWTRAASSDGRLPPKKDDQEQIVLLAALSAEQRRAYKHLRAEISSLQARMKEIGKLPAVFAGEFRQPDEPVFLLKGGNVMAREREIAPASLSTLDHLLPKFEVPPAAPESERRLAFAKWIAHPENPLTPRVLANRIWHYHFGRGIVGTPSDFGMNGEKPSHPELLDYLAARLLHHGWRMKPLHKEIVMSAAYRQAGGHNEEYARADAESRYLWRFPPQRLTAEAIRDSILAVAGKLNRKLGGPGFLLSKYTIDNVSMYLPLERFGEETYRRAVYLQSARSIRPELLAQYDCPDSSLPEPKRVVTTSPLQALSLLNNSFILDMAEAFAGRLRLEAGDNLEAQVRRAFALAFVRRPNQAELEAAMVLAGRHGLAALCRALFNANEFVYVM